NPGGHTSAVRKVLFTPDGKKLISVSRDKTIRVTDLLTGDTLRVLRLPIGAGAEGSLHAAALSPDGKRLAVGGMPFGLGAHGIMIHMIRLDPGQLEGVLRGHTTLLLDLDFSRDGKYLASSSGDGTARVYDLGTGKSQAFVGHKDRIRQVRFSPNGKYLGTVGTENSAR